MTAKQSSRRRRRGRLATAISRNRSAFRAALFARKVPPAEVMRELGVSRQNVSSPRSQVLLAGARASGFAGDLWTLARVAQVIEQHTGVAHHPEHVWRLLRGLGWSVQRPARRRGSKGAARRKAIIVFWDESGISVSGISVIPVVRPTWAPRGATPVLVHPFNWKRTSMAAALCPSAWWWRPARLPPAAGQLRHRLAHRGAH